MAPQSGLNGPQRPYPSPRRSDLTGQPVYSRAPHRIPSCNPFHRSAGGASGSSLRGDKGTVTGSKRASTPLSVAPPIQPHRPVSSRRNAPPTTVPAACRLSPTHERPIRRPYKTVAPKTGSPQKLGVLFRRTPRADTRTAPFRQQRIQKTPASLRQEAGVRFSGVRKVHYRASAAP